MADDSATRLASRIARHWLAWPCRRQRESDREKYKDTLARVDFLESLGLPAKDAAEAAGSTAASVSELKRLRRNKGNGKKVGKKKAVARRR